MQIRFETNPLQQSAMCRNYINIYSFIIKLINSKGGIGAVKNGARSRISESLHAGSSAERKNYSAQCY